MKDKVTGDQSESEASGLETGADSGGLTVTAYSRRESESQHFHLLTEAIRPRPRYIHSRWGNPASLTDMTANGGSSVETAQINRAQIRAKANWRTTVNGASSTVS